MDERRDPLTNAPDEGELLAAYLDGETDDVTSARIERRLHTDPTVAAKLDALAHVRARLQRLDEVEPPAGFRERLDARLRSERAQGRPATPPATSMQPAKARRTSRASRLMPFAVAASLLLLAVLGGAALLSVRTGGGGESVSAEFEANADGAEARDAPMAAPEEEAAGEEAAARRSCARVPACPHRPPAWTTSTPRRSTSWNATGSKCCRL
jgi:negative regulator of sigma E activity